jgi:hypothetical protein
MNSLKTKAVESASQRSENEDLLSNPCYNVSEVSSSLSKIDSGAR